MIINKLLKFFDKKIRGCCKTKNWLSNSHFDGKGHKTTTSKIMKKEIQTEKSGGFYLIQRVTATFILDFDVELVHVVAKAQK